jgi:hypothetical protein
MDSQPFYLFSNHHRKEQSRNSHLIFLHPTPSFYIRQLLFQTKNPTELFALLGFSKSFLDTSQHNRAVVG